MSKTFGVRVLLGCLVMGAIVIGGVSPQQMMGVSGTYELFPLNTMGGSASFPLILREGKTILVNTVEYQRTVYDFDDWDFVQGTAGDTEEFHSAGYSLLLIQQLTEKWMLMANGRPYLASDFEGDISLDDLGFTVMAMAASPAWKSTGQVNAQAPDPNVTRAPASAAPRIVCRMISLLPMSP